MTKLIRELDEQEPEKDDEMPMLLTWSLGEGDIVYVGREKDGFLSGQHLNHEKWTENTRRLSDASLADLRQKIVRVLIAVEDEMEDRHMLGRVTKRGT
jgi:hypothetical protein